MLLLLRLLRALTMKSALQIVALQINGIRSVVMMQTIGVLGYRMSIPFRSRNLYVLHISLSAKKTCIERFKLFTFLLMSNREYRITVAFCKSASGYFMVRQYQPTQWRKLWQHRYVSVFGCLR